MQLLRFRSKNATKSLAALRVQSLESSDTVFLLSEPKLESTTQGYIESPYTDCSLHASSSQVAECLDFASYVACQHSHAADERYDYYKHLQAGRRKAPDTRMRLDGRLESNERELRFCNLRHLYLAYLVLSNEFQRRYHQSKGSNSDAKQFKQFEDADLRIKAHFFSNLGSYNVGAEPVYAAGQVSSQHVHDHLTMLEVLQPDVDSGYNEEMEHREMEWRHYSSIAKVYNAESSMLPRLRTAAATATTPPSTQLDIDKMVHFQRRIEVCLAALQLLEDQIAAVNLTARIHRLLAFEKDGDDDAVECLLWELRDCMLYLKKYVDHVTKRYHRLVKTLVKVEESVGAEMSVYPVVSRAMSCFAYTFTTIGRFKI